MVMYISLKERKKNYYSNLDPSCTSDNKRLCTYLLRKERKTITVI